MEFRWVVIITLWTLLSGPMFASPRAPRSQPGGTSQPAPALQAAQGR